MIDKDLLDKVYLEGALRIIINEINNLCKEINLLKTNSLKSKITMEVKIKKLNPEAVIPTYGTDDSACFDFYCLENTTIDSGNTVIIKTGLSFEIPEGYFMSIVPRSSTGLKTPLRQSNSYGVIDSDYRGEIGLLFTNYDNKPYNVNKGDRIAQGFLLPVIRMRVVESNELQESERGEGGFGSTGK